MIPGREQAAPVLTATGVLDPVTWPGWVVWALALLGLAFLAVGLWEHTAELLGGGRRVPLVSLLMVVKNRERIIEGALRRLIARFGSAGPGGPRYEIVVVDDASDDDTPRILERLARLYPGFLRAVRFEEGDERVSTPARIGLAACRGRTVVVAAEDALGESPIERKPRAEGEYKQESVRVLEPGPGRSADRDAAGRKGRSLRG